MPTINLASSSRPWNIKSRNETPPSTSHNVVFAQPSIDSAPAQDMIAVFVVTAFFVSAVVVGVIVWIIVRYQPEGKSVETKAQVKTQWNSALELLVLKKKAGKPTMAPDVCAPRPTYAYSKVAVALEAMSVASEDSYIPPVVVSPESSEADLSQRASPAGFERSILDWAGTVEDKHHGNDCGKAVDDAHHASDSEGSTDEASFFSVEMLEGMSSIAEDLMQSSLSSKPIDVEVKSVSSRRSSILVIDPEDEQLHQACNVESFDVSDSTEKPVETLEDMILSLERMANGSGNSSIWSEGFRPDPTDASSSLHALKSLGSIGELDARDSTNKEKNCTGDSDFGVPETLTSTPLDTETRQDPTLDENEIPIAAPIEKTPARGYAIGLVPTAAAEPPTALSESVKDEGEPGFVSLSQSPRSSDQDKLRIEPKPILLVNQSNATVKETKSGKPSQARSILANVKTTASSKGASPLARTTYHHHVRSSSGNKSENRGTRKWQP